MAVTQVKQFEQPFNERYNLSWDDITVAGKKNFFVKKPFDWKQISKTITVVQNRTES